MAAGFNSPSILFLSTWDQAERDYMAALFPKLRAAGYTRLVEPCAGAFAMPSVAVEAGWPTAQLETSDVQLFSTLLGYAFADKPLEALDVRIDDVPFRFESDTLVRQSAEVLYVQLALRMQKRPDLPYWNELRHDITTRKTAIIDQIAADLGRIDARMHGCRYEARDCWDHIRAVADDPQTVISINPPTYKGGFEKFYDTGGRLTWAVPPYEVFDAGTDVFRLMEEMQGKAALMLCQQQQTPGNAAKWPVYARHLSLGQNVYVNTNRPDEVKAMAGGLKVMPVKPVELRKLDVPILPKEYDIPPDARIELMPVSGKEATYYRDLWMHKLDGKSAGVYVAVVVDGFMAGLFAYDTGPLIRPYPGLPEHRRGGVLLTFAVGAPHKDRLTRLMTMIALNWKAVKLALAPHHVAMMNHLVTVEMTRHPEAKGLRGLMTLEKRVKDPKYGWRLIYLQPPYDTPFDQVVSQWLTKEKAWRKSRQSSTSSAK